MVVIAFPADEVQNVISACYSGNHDKVWLLRTAVAITLSTPDLYKSASPGYLGPGCADLFGNDMRPNVEPISVFHKTLKIIRTMKPKAASKAWVEFHFRDQEFRICLTAREDGRRFTPKG